MIFGYVRATHIEQDLALQKRRVTTYIKKYHQKDVDENYLIYVDEQNEHIYYQNQFREMLKMVRKGDIVVVDTICRLGKITSHIANSYQELKERGVRVIMLDVPVMCEFYPLEKYTQNEYDLAVSTMECMFAKLKDNNRKEGQRKKVLQKKMVYRTKVNRGYVCPPNFDKYYQDYMNEVPIAKLCQMMKCDPVTFYKYIDIYCNAYQLPDRPSRIKAKARRLAKAQGGEIPVEKA